MQTRALGRQAAGAEDAATAKSALKIKELQDMLQRQEHEILDLGKQMDKKEDEHDKQMEQMKVYFPPLRATQLLGVHPFTITMLSCTFRCQKAVFVLFGYYISHCWSRRGCGTDWGRSRGSTCKPCTPLRQHSRKGCSCNSLRCMPKFLQEMISSYMWRRPCSE